MYKKVTTQSLLVKEKCPLYMPNEQQYFGCIVDDPKQKQTYSIRDLSICVCIPKFKIKCIKCKLKCCRPSEYKSTLCITSYRVVVSHSKRKEDRMCKGLMCCWVELYIYYTIYIYIYIYIYI